MTQAKTSSSAKKATSKKASTSVSQWRKSRTVELEVPSGNICLVRKPDLRDILIGGVIPDALSAVVRAGIRDPEAAAKALEGKEEDMETVVQFMDMMDSIVLATVLEPRVLPVPQDDDGKSIPFDDRDEVPEALYIDEVDVEDRMFIMSWVVGGTQDLEPFREGQE